MDSTHGLNHKYMRYDHEVVSHSWIEKQPESKLGVKGWRQTYLLYFVLGIMGFCLFAGTIIGGLASGAVLSRPALYLHPKVIADGDDNLAEIRPGGSPGEYSLYLRATGRLKMTNPSSFGVVVHTTRVDFHLHPVPPNKECLLVVQEQDMFRYLHIASNLCTYREELELLRTNESQEWEFSVKGTIHLKQDDAIVGGVLDDLIYNCANDDYITLVVRIDGYRLKNWINTLNVDATISSVFEVPCRRLP